LEEAVILFSSEVIFPFLLEARIFFCNKWVTAGTEETAKKKKRGKQNQYAG
jgi:hypothetical protein